MKIGIIGSGNVAKTLAAGFIAQGHEVQLGTRDPAQLSAFAQIRDQVLEDYQADQRQNANRTLYEEMRQRYQVRVADGILYRAQTTLKKSAP